MQYTVHYYILFTAVKERMILKSVKMQWRFYVSVKFYHSGSECSDDAWQWSSFTTLLPTPKYKIMYFVADVIVLLFPYNVYGGVKTNKTDMLISLHKCKQILSNNSVHKWMKMYVFLALIVHQSILKLPDKQPHWSQFPLTRSVLLQLCPKEQYWHLSNNDPRISENHSNLQPNKILPIFTKEMYEHIKYHEQHKDLLVSSQGVMTFLKPFLNNGYFWHVDKIIHANVPYYIHVC